MALKPTIYKFRISLSDLNRDYYDSLNLTVAQHPSETVERMMVRVIAFCLNASEHLVFTKGLCVADEPDIWLRTFDDKILLWIEVGEPSVERIIKATRHAENVKIYTFNSRSNIWWSENMNRFNRLNVSVFQFDWQNIESLMKFLQRTMDCSMTITDDSIYLATESGEYELPLHLLKS